MSRIGPQSPLSDGDWHRLHPLTPLLRGGLFLIVVIGFLLANLRDRLLQLVLPESAPGENPQPDPVEFVLSHNLVLVAILAVLAVAAVLVAGFWLSWRFHAFRITGDDVEVRSGVVFRTQRRAPLDRVQGVNLTRPLFARLLGLAKLEVVGAGVDANVRLEYLATARAEAVRADILRLASGRALQPVPPAGSDSPPPGAIGVLERAVAGILSGPEEPVDDLPSVVSIPPGRVVGSFLLRESTILTVVIGAGLLVWSLVVEPWLLLALIPGIVAMGAYLVRTITRTLRYAIAPTPHGVRIVFGLTTTVTEVLPPGRVHAVEIRQPLLWRGPGWWTVSVNRLSGSQGQDAARAFTAVLPVGTRADAERVVALLLPDLDPQERELIFARGLLAVGSDPFTTTPPRARVQRPVSWRRNGYSLGSTALFLRRGRIWRSLAVVPLARMQSIAVHQGPWDRMLDVAALRAHTVAGTVFTGVGAIGRADALAVFEEAEARALRLAAADRSHRWAREPVSGGAAG